jgi:NAD(P)-dependent dehydrogenase (short-subunit alcohol dehydrogenase family)
MARRLALVALQDAALQEAVAGSLREQGYRVAARAASSGEVLHVLVLDVTSPAAAPFVGADVERWFGEVQAALTRPFRLLREAVPALRRSGAGRIVLVGSGWTAADLPRSTAAAAVHGGVVALVKTLARDLGPQGITVNEVVLDAAAPAPPAAVAAAVAYLAGRDASTVAGQLLTLGAGGALRP